MARAGGNGRSWQRRRSGSGRLRGRGSGSRKLRGFGSGSWRLRRRGSGSGSGNVAARAAGSGGSWRERRSISRGTRRRSSARWDLEARVSGSGGSWRRRRTGSIGDSAKLPGPTSCSILRIRAADANQWDWISQLAVVLSFPESLRDGRQSCAKNDSPRASHQR